MPAEETMRPETMQPETMQPETMRLHAQSWIRNDSHTVPMGLLGVHNVPLTPERVDDWGVTGVRKIHQKPGKVTRIPGPDAQADIQARLATTTDEKARKNYSDNSDAPCRTTLSGRLIAFTIATNRRYKCATPSTGKRDCAPPSVLLSRRPAPVQQHYLEFYNEPYLNWATNPAVNYSPSYYKTDGVQPGDPMVNRFTGKTVPGLAWGEPRFYIPQRDRINYVISGYIPANAKPGVPTKLRYGAGTVSLEDGGTVTIRGREWPVAYGPWGRDVKQKHYWAGPGERRLV